MGDVGDPVAAAAGEAIHHAAPRADYESADSEEEAARAEGDVVRHVFIPRCE